MDITNKRSQENKFVLKAEEIDRITSRSTGRMPCVSD